MMLKRGDLIIVNGIPSVMVMISEEDLRLIGKDDWNRWERHK